MTKIPNSFNRFVLVFFIILCLLMNSTFVKGQYTETATLSISLTGLNPIALMDIEPSVNKNISFNISSPAEAGAGFDLSAQTNTSLWINYTCTRIGGAALKKISVRTSGTLPTGIILKVKASTRSLTAGNGTFGIPGSELLLSPSDQILLSGIGACFTGDGESKGHQLTFSLSISDSDYSQLTSGILESIQVIYTLSD